MNNSQIINVYRRLYLQGLSTYMIAKKLNKSRSTVYETLINRGVTIRKSQGRDVEEKVALWLEERGMNVNRQKGDCSFDLLVDGVKIDVKSAHLNKNKNHLAYYFELKHKHSLYTDYKKDIDIFYLVFLDEVNTPIYSIKTRSVNISCLSIPKSFKSKHPIKFIGYLDLKVKNNKQGGRS